MARRSRAWMNADTRGKLLAAGGKGCGEKGYAEASMDDFTAEAGLTRGALYHHFGGKKGLFEAVVRQIDVELAQRLKSFAAEAPTRWEGFVRETIGYVELALDPEIQRTLLRDGPALLGNPSGWPSAHGGIATIRAHRERPRAEGVGGDESGAAVAPTQIPAD